MKLFTNKEFSKKIIIAILLVMSFNFISPTISQADAGGALFKPISQFISWVADLIIQGLQTYFIGYGDISDNAVPNTDDKIKSYYIRYSPGIIFSGTVPGLKVNFINASKDEDDKQKYENIQTKYVHPDNGKENEGKEYNYEEDINEYGYNEDNQQSFYVGIFEFQVRIWINEETDKKYIAVHRIDNSEEYLKEHAGNLNSPHMPDEAKHNLVVYEVKEEHNKPPVEKTSSALTLQYTVATWYKALRAIALVGLLSVLVYVGIRILISSTGQEKAKYKKIKRRRYINV